jgi:hypothetical protein
VLFDQGILAEGLELLLYWSGCAVEGAPAERADAWLYVWLPWGSPDAVLWLGAASAMSQHAFQSGRVTLSIQEPAPGVAGAPGHWLLTPLGFLTRAPAAKLPNDAAQSFDHQIRPVAQLAAYYDDLGRGLYLATADDTGLATKNFRFHAAPDRSAWRYEAISYAADVTNPAASLESLPLVVGRFWGDWYDAADRYRQWLSGTTIASGGLAALRNDISAYLKGYQHLIVLSPMLDYVSPCGGFALGQEVNECLKVENCPAAEAWSATLSVPERLDQYDAHWDLERTSALQFASVWPECGDDGVGAYLMSPTWAQSAALMEAAGRHYFVYLYDAWYRTGTGQSCDVSFDAQGWLADTVVGIGGLPRIETHVLGGIPREYALIDPSSAKWLARMAEVGLALAARGVDGAYLDNFFPDLSGACFAWTAAHAPGYGTYLTQGFAESLRIMRQSAAILEPGFTTTSEVAFEAYLRVSDTCGPAQASADLATGDEATDAVPLHAVLYHHLAIQGPCSAGYYTRPPSSIDPGCACAGLGPDAVSVFACDPAERERARRGALYTLGYGWVNGSPLWSPDFGATNPKCYAFSFELPPPAPGQPDCLRDYQDVCAFAASLSRLRGEQHVQPFLNVGLRLRDLPVLSPMPELTIDLSPILVGQQDRTHAPALLQGVWKDVLGQDVALAFVNHGPTDLAGVQVWVDPTQWDPAPHPSWVALGVEPDGVVTQVGPAFPGGAGSVLSLPVLPAESALFLRLTRAPEPRSAPPVGGGSSGTGTIGWK